MISQNWTYCHPEAVEDQVSKSRSAFRVAGMDYSGDKTAYTIAISGKIINL